VCGFFYSTTIIYIRGSVQKNPPPLSFSIGLVGVGLIDRGGVWGRFWGVFFSSKTAVRKAIISLYNAEGQKISTSVHGKEGVFLAKIREILKIRGKLINSEILKNTGKINLRCLIID
jgi:hypothetical protein